jgi:hypothetical protein
MSEVSPLSLQAVPLLPPLFSPGAVMIRCKGAAGRKHMQFILASVMAMSNWHHHIMNSIYVTCPRINDVIHQPLHCGVWGAEPLVTRHLKVSEFKGHFMD